MEQPKVIDFDDGEISVRLDGKELRGWSYKDDAERRIKMLAAREYVDDWCDGHGAPAAAPPSPGYRLVPYAPTQEMLDAVTSSVGYEPWTDKTMTSVYQEMLDEFDRSSPAAPAPLATSRDDLIEQCAKIAETAYSRMFPKPANRITAENAGHAVAAAIRALAEREKTGT